MPASNSRWLLAGYVQPPWITLTSLQYALARSDASIASVPESRSPVWFSESSFCQSYDPQNLCFAVAAQVNRTPSERRSSGASAGWLKLGVNTQSDVFES